MSTESIDTADAGTSAGAAEKDQEIRDHVRDQYGSIAKAAQAAEAPQGASCCAASGASIEEYLGHAKSFAGTLGYTEDELAELPEGANLGLSCGNPVALAGLAEGDVVLDLGSGGGFDCFIAGRKVGASGRVIGVDMTAEMISKARSGLAKYRELSGFDNVEFRLGEIEHLPVADASVDVLISNCVLNLSTEKAQVWREIGRVLKPGGRVAVSDIALLQPIPEAISSCLFSLSACLTGAVSVSEYEQHMADAGLENIAIKPKPGGGDVWDSYKDPILDEIRAKLPEGMRIGDFAASMNIEARKPGGESRESGEGSAAGAVESACCEPAAGAKTSGGCC